MEDDLDYLNVLKDELQTKQITKSINKKKAKIIGESILLYLKHNGLLSQDLLKKISKNINRTKREIYPTPNKFNVPVDEKIWDTVQEMKNFISGFKNPQYKFYFKILAWTGIRPCEAKRIKAEDFDLENEELYIRLTKNGNNFVKVPLPHKLCEEIKHWLKYREKNVRIWTFSLNINLRKVFRRRCKEIGGKYIKKYGHSTLGQPLYFFKQTSFRKFYQTLVATNDELIGRALHDTSIVARKYYFTQKNKIKYIINKLY